MKVYGGGVSEVEFLDELSKLIGDFDLLSRNVSFGGRQGRSTSRSTRREKILDVAELGALPTGRIVVMASGARPTLAKPTPYWEQPYAKAIEASRQAHDPSRDEHRFDDLPQLNAPAASASEWPTRTHRVRRDPRPARSRATMTRRRRKRSRPTPRSTRSMSRD